MKTPAAIYEIGTLRYTLPKLILICFWILCAYLAIDLLAYKMVPTLMPVLLDRHHLSSTEIALILSSIPAIVNTVLCPLVSTLSDKTRTRWGRRIPYLALSAPFIVGFMILIAFEPEITGLLHRTLFPASSCDRIGFWVLAILMTLYIITFQIPGSIVYYVVADVVPKRFIGTFMGSSAFFGTGLAFVFNCFVLDRAVEDPKFWFILIGVLYLLIYFLLCCFVREGQYPPVDDRIETKAALPVKVKEYIALYFRECYSHRIYVMLFLTAGLTQASTVCRGMFNLLFALKDLNMTPAEFGHTMAIGALVSAVIILPMGKIMDIVHPLRVYFFSGLIVIAMNLWGYFFVYDAQSFMIVGIAIVLTYAIQTLSGIPLLIALVPPEQYGQFCSANSMVNSGIMIIASFLGGYCTDFFGYRMIFIWDFLLTIAATGTLLVVWRDWRKFGGSRNYVPPAVKSREPADRNRLAAQ